MYLLLYVVRLRSLPRQSCGLVLILSRLPLDRCTLTKRARLEHGGVKQIMEIAHSCAQPLRSLRD